MCRPEVASLPPRRPPKPPPASGSNISPKRVAERSPECKAIKARRGAGTKRFGAALSWQAPLVLSTPLVLERAGGRGLAHLPVHTVCTALADNNPQDAASRSEHSEFLHREGSRVLPWQRCTYCRVVLSTFRLRVALWHPPKTVEKVAFDFGEQKKVEVYEVPRRVA